MRDQNITWWDTQKDKLADVAFAWVNHCTEANRILRYESTIYVEVAHNFNVDGNSRTSAGTSLRQALPFKIRENIIRSACDSVAALVSQSRTSPQFTTTDSDWDTSRRAEKKSWVLQAQLLNLGLFESTPRAFVDACEAGTGFLVGSLGPDNQPRFERCLPNEVLCDPEDGRYGDPETVGRIKFIARGELEKLYPRKRDRLATSGGPTTQDYSDFWISPITHSDRVKVVELWHKPTIEGGDDGRHIITANNVVLVDETYRRRRIPCVRVVYAKRSQGWYGQGIAERMFPAQVQICKMDHWLERFLDLTNVYWIIDANSEVKAGDLTNMPGQVLHYEGGAAPPQMVTFDSLPQGYLQYREATKQRAFENEGISGAVATGDVQNGLTSGKAIRASDDVGSRRFINATKNLEASYLDICHVLSDLNDDAAAIDPQYQVTAKRRAGKRTWQTRTKWADLYLDPRDVTVTMWPISTTATLTPSAKWSTLQEWIEAGFISQAQGLDQMGMPDPEQVESLDNSNLDLVYEQISQMLDAEGDERMFLPIPMQDLALAGHFVNLAYLSAWRNGAPDDILMRFENFLAYLKQLTDAAAPPPPAADPNALPPVDPNAAPMPVDPNAAPMPEEMAA